MNYINNNSAVDNVENLLKKCSLCPRKCEVDRKNNKFGFCKAGSNVKIAKASMHYFEEPCISGCRKKDGDNLRGSGTVFFSNCNLKCVFCQNYKISQEGFGIEISIEKLSDIFLKLQENGAYNINLVSPTIYACQIKESIIIAKKKGLSIPIIYNCSGYELVETVKMLDGYIDVYLPDFKYFDDEIAKKYSRVDRYFYNASMSILEMYKQVGSPIFDENGMIQKGLIIRHMVLPNNIKNTKKVLEWISENLGKEAFVSVMGQYFPTNIADKYEEINRKVTKKEMEIVKLYIDKLGLTNGYIQKLGKNEERYVPDFDLSGI